MRASLCLCIAVSFTAGPAFADPESSGPEGSGGTVVTDAQIRSGAIIDDGLDIPSIRPGTQYFEIHGSTRIQRALDNTGAARLPTDNAGLAQSDEDEDAGREIVTAW